MKRTLLFVFVIFCCGITATAQTPYTSSQDAQKVMILNGILSKSILINEPSFSWYKSNQQGYNPDTSLLTRFENAKSNVRYLVFGGTWCEDTQNILPKFFKLLEKSGTPDSNVSFFGVDRKKKTLGNFADVFQITNVPTIIVMKDGKEVGRVIEYGKTGKWDTEIAELIK